MKKLKTLKKISNSKKFVTAMIAVGVVYGIFALVYVLVVNANS